MDGRGCWEGSGTRAGERTRKKRGQVVVGEKQKRTRGGRKTWVFFSAFSQLRPRTAVRRLIMWSKREPNGNGWAAKRELAG